MVPGVSAPAPTTGGSEPVRLTGTPGPPMQTSDGDRVRASYSSGRIVEGIWTAIDCGLGGFRLRTDDGRTHIYAAGQVHCQVLEAWVTPEGVEVGCRATPSG